MVAGVYTSHIGLGFKLRASWYNRRGKVRQDLRDRMEGYIDK